MSDNLVARLKELADIGYEMRFLIKSLDGRVDRDVIDAIVEGTTGYCGHAFVKELKRKMRGVASRISTIAETLTHTSGDLYDDNHLIVDLRRIVSELKEYGE